MLLGYRQSLRSLPKPLFPIAHAIFDDRQGLHDPQGRNTTPPRSGTTQSSAVRCQAFLCRVLQNSDLMAKRNAFQLQSCAAFPWTRAQPASSRPTQLSNEIVYGMLASPIISTSSTFTRTTDYQQDHFDTAGGEMRSPGSGATCGQPSRQSMVEI